MATRDEQVAYREARIAVGAQSVREEYTRYLHRLVLNKESLAENSRIALIKYILPSLQSDVETLIEVLRIGEDTERTEQIWDRWLGLYKDPCMAAIYLAASREEATTTGPHTEGSE